MKKKKFKLQVYHGEIIIIKSDDIRDIEKEYGFDHLKTKAMVFRNPKEKEFNSYVLAYTGEMEPHIIAHEVVHLVNYIFEDHGVLLDLVNDEPQAYLTGHLHRRINKITKKLDKCLKE